MWLFLSSFFCICLGILIDRSYLEIIKTSNNEIKKENVILNNNEKIIKNVNKNSIKECSLPKYVITSLRSKNIDYKKLDNERWEFFLDLYKKESFSEIKQIYHDQNLLDIAINSSNLHFIAKLLDLGFDINQKSKGFMNPITYAVSNGDLQTIEFLVDNGAILSVADGNSMDLLDYAFIRIDNKIKKSEVISYLLKNTKLNLKNDSQKYFNSMINGYNTTSKELIDKLINYIDPNTKINNTFTNFEMALKVGMDDERISKLINDYDFEGNKDGFNALHSSSFNKNISDTIFKKIIMNTKDIDSLDTIGNTPLMYAVKNLDYNKIKILLQNNANVNLVNSLGQTTFDMLKKNNYNKDSKLIMKIETLLKEYT